MILDSDLITSDRIQFANEKTFKNTFNFQFKGLRFATI